MRKATGLVLVAIAAAVSAAESPDPIVAQVRARDAQLGAAHARGDLETYLAGLSKRYVYIDIGGQRVTAEKLRVRRASDQRRVVSSESLEDEALRLSDSVVLLRGLERSVATYWGGLPRVGTSRWSALWVREEDGVWRLTAETATTVREVDHLPYVHVPQPAATLAALAGRWSLALDPPLTLVLAAEDGALVGTIPGQQVRLTFRPASPSHFFAEERPFELRFGKGAGAATLVTWGTPTPATRAAP
jgi:hypothetical protein